MFISTTWTLVLCLYNFVLNLFLLLLAYSSERVGLSTTEIAMAVPKSMFGPRGADVVTFRG